LPKLKIAVVGSGVAGLSCAWALSQRHDVTLIEANNRIGGHANTVTVKTPEGPVDVDTGFIVFNTWTYPNFTAMMDYLDQAVTPTQMSFAVTADGGRYEYSGNHLGTLIGTARQWLSPSHWRMMADLLRFYRKAETHVADVKVGTSLGQYLRDFGYGESFIQRHILPMSGAIWSATPDQIAAYPFHAFIQFFSNHRLFNLGNRPDWHTVAGGSREYVKKLIDDARFQTRLSSPIEKLLRHSDCVELQFASGEVERFDQVVLATHADTAYQILASPSALERELLSVFKTSANTVYLHRDKNLMPKRRRFWSGWNYLLSSSGRSATPEVTYWMNALQKLTSKTDHFVSLNPTIKPDVDLTDGTYFYRHPLFDEATLSAQKQLWSLQGVDRVWYCGAWFGSGFHEDGLQSGLAVAEQLGGVRRPWNVENESGRIHLHRVPHTLPDALAEAAE
jgi:uncharacterized protein